jgi:hypothetical protein
MTTCPTTTIGQALSYCAEGPYGFDAPLNIGELVDPSITDIFVQVENLATGRTSFHVNTATLPVVSIDHPAGLSPGQMYRISIVKDMATEVMFRPYTLVGNAYAIGTVQTDAVTVNLRKIVDGNGDIFKPAEQWVNI